MGVNSLPVALSLPQEVTDPAEIARICRFRAQVRRDIGQTIADAFPVQGWRDPIDEECRHWIIRGPAGQLLAAGRLSVHATLDEVHQAEEYRRYGLDLTGPIAAPDRVVVSPAMHGAGLGRRILDVQDETARQMGTRHAVRQASPGMVRLITQRRWRVVGPASPDARFPGVPFHIATKSFDNHAGELPCSH